MTKRAALCSWMCIAATGALAATGRPPGDGDGPGRAGVGPAASSSAVPDSFPAAYIDAHAGRRTYRVAEGVELAMILTAVAYREKEIRRHPVRRDTEYYRDVLEHFAPFADHPVFDAIRLDPRILDSYKDFRNNAYSWTFCERVLCRLDFLGKWWAGEQFDDGFSPHIEAIRDFAEVSDFRGFFEDHRSYYGKLAAIYEQSVDLREAIGWLATELSIDPHSSYQILFSPLIRGNQTTTIKRSGAFSEVFMIVGPPPESADPVDLLNSFVWIFTELDHQFVDPVSDRFAGRVEEVFSHREVWTGEGESRHYEDGLRIFNEYMTWATYVLYVHDHFEPAVAERNREGIVRYLETRRGFPRFGPFLHRLSVLTGRGHDPTLGGRQGAGEREGADQLQDGRRAEDRGKFEGAGRAATIAESYPALLEWASGLVAAGPERRGR